MRDILATISPVAADTIFHGPDLVSYVCDSKLNFIGEPSTVLCRRQDLLALLAEPDGLFFLGGFDMPFFIDMSLYVKLLQRGNLAYLVQPLSAFRVSAQQTTQEAQQTPQLAIETYKNFPVALKNLGWYKPVHPELSAVVRTQSWLRPKSGRKSISKWDLCWGKKPL